MKRLTTLSSIFLNLLIITACSSSGSEDDPIIDSDTFIASISDTSFDFGDVAIDASSEENFTINNTGTGSISISDITSNANFTVSPTSANIAAGTNKTFSITFSPNIQQEFTQTISVSSNNTNGDLNISLNGYGIEPFYKNTIAPIIAQNCSTTGCHNAASKSGGISMTNFLETKSAFVDDKAWDEIVAVRMPKGGSLTQTQKDDLLNWIESEYTDGVVETITIVSYTTDIAPIINQSCATTACHDNVSPSSGLNLSTFDLVKVAFQGTGTNSAIGRIERGNMPKTGGMLTQAKIDLLKKWIDGGFIQ